MPPRSPNLSFRSELIRWFALACVATWTLHPFATNRMIGTGDALWYAQMLADFVTQLRDGHFPVFVGQTEWAWNGAVYPLRVAPLYQHWGGFIDLLTAHRLGWFALQHTIVILSGTLGLIAAYLALRALDRTAPWRACVLACLYLSCPGILGTIYTQDLYMTWMILPFPPFALLGTVRTFERDDVTAQLLLATGLAGAWLAHAPIALWLTLIVGAAQVVRLLLVHRRRCSWRLALIGAGAFGLLGSYPFISVALLKVPGAEAVVANGLANDQQITQTIRDVFPRVMLPLSEGARALSDLQLGYALWALLGLAAVGLIAGRKNGDREDIAGRALSLLLVAACVGLLVLLLPVPFLTDWLWSLLPGQIKRITFYWPMHRFYLLLAILIVVALQLVVRRAPGKWQSSVMIVAGVGLAWSVWEARQFVRAGSERTATSAISLRVLRPENRLLMNHSYGLFAGLPDHFTNGVTDPRCEVRLFEAGGGEEHRAPIDDEGFVRATGRIDLNPGVLRLNHEMTLQPGERYALDFRFHPRDYAGILQLSGMTFFREYQLPHSGERRAFGSKPDNSPTIPVWTTAREPENVTLRFIPTAAGATPGQFSDFGELRLRRIDPAAEPVELLGLTPLRVHTRANKPTKLQTPRMALLGYAAWVDGAIAQIEVAPGGTVQVPVPAGEHIVEIIYRAPLWVRVSYFATLAAWLAIAVCGAIIALRLRVAGGALAVFRPESRN